MVEFAKGGIIPNTNPSEDKVPAFIQSLRHVFPPRAFEEINKDLKVEIEKPITEGNVTSIKYTISGPSHELDYLFDARD